MKWRKHSKHRYALILTAILAAVLIYVLFFWPSKTSAPSQTDLDNQSNNQIDKPKEPAEPEYPLIDLQPAVDQWAENQAGTSSVVVYDLENNKTVAKINPGEQYFTASIYKLYVAYVGYQRIADGTYSLDDPYLTDYTRGKCLDAMIRDSYSPCGEKMWAELGKEEIDSELLGYGLSNTSMTALHTSADDAANILKRIHNRTDLTEEHAKLLLDSLKGQPAKYRRGLPTGMPKATVYNKVGWNLDQEWHDTAIVTLKNGRSYVVSVLTSGVGMTGVAELGKALYDKMSSSGGS